MRFLLSIFLLVLTTAFAQKLPSFNYTTSDGLPNNAVRSLFIAKDNVLWVGTENGVSRFVNGQFYNLSEADGLGHNSCWDISQDTDGNMWFASYGGGISKYDGKKFTPFISKDGLAADKTRKLFPFKNNIYVGTEQGISIIDVKTNKIVTPKVPKAKEDFICINFFVYKNEVYFVSVFDGIFKIDESSTIPKVVPVYSGKNFYGALLDKNDLLLSREGFIEKINIKNLLNANYKANRFGTSFVFQYAKVQDSLIFAAADGVYNPDGGLYKIENDKMINVSNQFEIDSKIILNVVYDTLRNVLYVGSNDKGIYEIRLDATIKYEDFKNLSIVDFEFLDQSKFVLHNKGLSILNSSDKITNTILLNEFKNFQTNYFQNNRKKLNTIYRESHDFELNFNIKANEIVFYELVKNKKSIWIGSNLGVFEINSKGKIINYIPKHSLKIGFTSDNKFIETITYAGVHVYDNVYQLQGKHYSKFDNKTPQFIVKILNNKDKTYLISVFNGLFVHQNGKFKSYLFENIWKEKKIKHIVINNKGQLVLAAEFGTVFIVDDSKKFKILKTISKKEIIGNSINFLECYKDYIFIGTEKGVNIYHNGKIRLIDKEQGLKDCIFKTSQIFENELWLGTQNGFYKLNLDKLLSKQKTVEKVVIQSILINNQSFVGTNSRWFTFNSNELTTDYKNNSFSIDFIPVGHPFPNKLKFRYRLNSKNNWSPYTDKPTVFLSYLPYGKYHLEIEILDLNSGETKQFKVLNLVITPPFWLTWWFAIIVFSVLSALVFVVVKRKKKSAEEKALINQRIAETKLEALKSQMNPHFTFNAMNTIQDFIISNDIDNSLNFVSELAKLMRLTLDNSTKKTITLQEEISFLKNYIFIENTRFGNKIKVNLKVESNINAQEIEVPTMLLQPFIENVFVHAFNAEHLNPTIDILFQLKETNILECYIKDNGKGKASFNKVKLHQSKALLLAEERLRLIQPQILNPITTNFTESNGTFVVILLQV
ncbi:sensor histidine kinase [Flavobacterium psychrophilum]|uniref:sensor histidine kinase n=1 Tax=Flavobacterium psychrophilum TaxID=96345 RepID=UPI000B7C0DB1|nr:histidine kinase [Flavobacterium psychrophilum]SNA64720.1 Two-component system sensor histidine kinase [Flavobacterium psychrophilum]